MLTTRELAEMRQLVARAQHGTASREDWSNLAALSLLSQDGEVLINMAAGGYEMFRRVCRPQYACHGFQDIDYRRIYARVCVAAAKHSQAIVH